MPFNANSHYTLYLFCCFTPTGTGGPSIVNEGDDALLTCVVMNPFINETVIWRKGPHEIL